MFATNIKMTVICAECNTMRKYASFPPHPFDVKEAASQVVPLPCPACHSHPDMKVMDMECDLLLDVTFKKVELTSFIARLQCIKCSAVYTKPIHIQSKDRATIKKILKKHATCCRNECDGKAEYLSCAQLP